MPVKMSPCRHRLRNQDEKEVKRVRSRAYLKLCTYLLTYHPTMANLVLN
jgi:hypothetical protein